MAFIGMVIAGIAVIIFIAILIIMLVLLVTAITLKIVGKNKNSKKMRTAGNVLHSLCSPRRMDSRSFGFQLHV